MKKSLACWLLWPSSLLPTLRHHSLLILESFELVDPKKDQRVVQGYTVGLRGGFDLTHSFDIPDEDN